MNNVYIRGNFVVSTNPDLLDIDAIHTYLSQAYWSPGISQERVVKAIQNSLCFGLYEGDVQIGFARVGTDYTQFAYLMDVFVLDSCQGQGLGMWLIECILAYPALQGVNMFLVTRDAQSFYKKFGFQEIDNPQNIMKKKLVRI